MTLKKSDKLFEHFAFSIYEHCSYLYLTQNERRSRYKMNNVQEF
jgi:hypothetical protein